jgi:hypothetical protein
MSEHDIRAGAVWEDELVDNLDATDCGVLALTRENQTAPWLLFEAGVLSKSANRKRVIPYRVDLVLGEVAAPLTRFQGVDADLVGTKKLVLSLNTASAHPMPDKHVDVLFDALWPQLESELSIARTATPKIGAVRRSPEEYLQEILSLLRGTETPGPVERSPSTSSEDPIGAISSLVRSLESNIASMEEYEKNGGGASTESWWDAYVERRRDARSLYLKALDLVKEADSQLARRIQH